MQKIYKVDREHAKLCKDDAIFLGLRTFREAPKETALFRVWCALQISDQIDRTIPHLRHHSLQAAIRELELLEWILVDEESATIKIIV